MTKSEFTEIKAVTIAKNGTRRSPPISNEPHVYLMMDTTLSSLNDDVDMYGKTNEKPTFLRKTLRQ